MIDIVFFDVGETLLRPYPTFHELFARLCTEAGYGVDAAEVGRVQQRLAPHLVELAEESGVQDPSLSTLRPPAPIGATSYRRLLQEVGVEDEAPGRPHVLDVLEQCLLQAVRRCASCWAA